MATRRIVDKNAGTDTRERSMSGGNRKVTVRKVKDLEGNTLHKTAESLSPTQRRRRGTLPSGASYSTHMRRDAYGTVSTKAKKGGTSLERIKLMAGNGAAALQAQVKTRKMSKGRVMTQAQRRIDKGQKLKTPMSTGMEVTKETRKGPKVVRQRSAGVATQVQSKGLTRKK